MEQKTPLSRPLAANIAINFLPCKFDLFRKLLATNNNFYGPICWLMAYYELTKFGVDNWTWELSNQSLAEKGWDCSSFVLLNFLYQQLLDLFQNIVEEQVFVEVTNNNTFILCL
jgi:hypothetical protein